MPYTTTLPAAVSSLITACSPLLIPAAAWLVYYLADGLRLHYTFGRSATGCPCAKYSGWCLSTCFSPTSRPWPGWWPNLYLTRHGVPVARATAATTIRTVLAVIFIFSLTPVFLLTLDVLDGGVWSSGVARPWPCS